MCGHEAGKQGGDAQVQWQVSSVAGGALQRRTAAAGMLCTTSKCSSMMCCCGSRWWPGSRTCNCVSPKELVLPASAISRVLSVPCSKHPDLLKTRPLGNGNGAKEHCERLRLPQHCIVRSKHSHTAAIAPCCSMLQTALR